MSAALKRGIARHFYLLLYELIVVCYNLCVAAASQLMSQKIKTTYKASTSKVIKLYNCMNYSVGYILMSNMCNPCIQMFYMYMYLVTHKIDLIKLTGLSF